MSLSGLGAYTIYDTPTDESVMCLSAILKAHIWPLLVNLRKIIKRNCV